MFELFKDKKLLWTYRHLHHIILIPVRVNAALYVPISEPDEISDHSLHNNSKWMKVNNLKNRVSKTAINRNIISGGPILFDTAFRRGSKAGL